MPNGRPGDHPLSDFLLHGSDVFPQEICSLIREVHERDPFAFECEDSVRRRPSWQEIQEESGDWHAWAMGEDLEGATFFLNSKLELASALRTSRDPAADWVRDKVEAEFAWLSPSRLPQRTTFPLDHPSPDSRGLRIEHDLVYLCEGYEPESLQFALYTYPFPEILFLSCPVVRFKSGDHQGVIEWLTSCMTGDRALVLMSQGYQIEAARGVKETELNPLSLNNASIEVRRWKQKPR